MKTPAKIKVIGHWKVLRSGRRVWVGPYERREGARRGS